MARIALLHPGAMGASVGAVLRAQGHTVVWCRRGRSAASLERAEAAGLDPVDDLATALGGADGVVSIVPPDRALDVAHSVAAALGEVGNDAWYLDANAISPATARQVAAVVEAAGLTPVDGGIVGPPVDLAGTTRLALSGHVRAVERVTQMLAGSPLATLVVGDRIGAASAFKLAFAGWTKGSSALLLGVAAYARAEGVLEDLLGEWDERSMGVRARLEGSTSSVVPKAWRFAGEMEEISEAWSDVGLPAELFASAGDLYRRLSDAKDDPTFGLDDVLTLLTTAPGESR